MSNGRNIILILGNGFDLDLGLPTSYKDFWKSEYCPKNYPAPLIRYLNEKWADNLDNVRWYDLENELYNYYIKIKDDEIGEGIIKHDIITPEEQKLIKIIEPYKLDFGVHYGKPYLITSLWEKKIIVRKDVLSPPSIPYQEDLLQPSYWRDKKALDLIKEGLCKYLDSIMHFKGQSISVARFVYNAIVNSRNSQDHLEIFSFNYTDTQRLLNSSNCTDIHYVHGKYEDNNIILGTGDYLEFDERYDFLQKAFDPKYNPPALVSEINDSDEIIFFGHSLGDNDKQYFKLFFNNQSGINSTQRKIITFFTKDEESEHQIKRSLRYLTRGNLSSLFSHNEITFIKTGCIDKDDRKLEQFFIDHGYKNEEYKVSKILGELKNEMNKRNQNNN